MSLKFLNLKGWHPSNKANQKKIWIAEQEAIQRERSEKEAAAEALKQQDLLRFKQVDILHAQTSFSYDLLM